MGLTSGFFIGLLIAAALASVAVTAWLWPRLASQRIAVIAGRLGLIAASQLLVISAVLFLLNGYLGFFGSWSSLPATAARLAAGGQIGPAVYVMMNVSVALPRDTECTNVPAAPQALTFLAQGGHNYGTWQRQLPQSLEWISRRLTPARPETPHG